MQRRLGFNHGSECPTIVASIFASWTSEVVDERRGLRFDRPHTIHGYSCRWENGQWCREKPLTTDKLCDVWPWIHSLTQRKRCCWLFGYGLQQQAELLGMWDQIERGSLRWRDLGDSADGSKSKRRYGVLCADGLPWMFRGLLNGRSLRIVDICNYAKLTLEEFAASIGYLCIKPSDIDFAAMTPDARSMHSARVVYEWTRQAIDRWRDGDRGTWQPTAAKLALNAYKHHSLELDRQWLKSLGKLRQDARVRINPNLINTHDRADVKKLEREAYYGGQSEAYYLGYLRQSVHYIDVRAMYPFVAVSTLLPVRYFKPLGACSPKLLRTYLEPWIGIADVTIAGPSSMYPCRVDEARRIRIIPRRDDRAMGEWFAGPMVVYPEGRYRTTLAGSELLDALRRGLVETVHDAHLYQSGKPFNTFMQDWFAERIKCHDSGDSVGESLCKMIMNSLLAKFAQRASIWEDVDDTIGSKPWDVFYAHCASTGRTDKFRSVGHHVQRFVGHAELEQSAIAIPACVTAAGRQYMRAIRESIGAGRIILQDTDGLAVTDAGLLVAKETANFGKMMMGALNVKSRADSIEVFGPRHYRWGDKWTLAGIGRGWQWSNDGKMQHWVTDWLYSRMMGLTHGTFSARLKPWDLNRSYSGRYRLKDGWTEPLLVGI